MPKQRKRRNQQRGGPLRGAGAGRWEVVFETQDAAEWQRSVPRVRDELGLADASMLRVDTLCGRSEQPTTYRLSMFVPYPQAATPSPQNEQAEQAPQAEQDQQTEQDQPERADRPE